LHADIQLNMRISYFSTILKYYEPCAANLAIAEAASSSLSASSSSRSLINDGMKASILSGLSTAVVFSLIATISEWNALCPASLASAEAAQARTLGRSSVRSSTSQGILPTRYGWNSAVHLR